MYEVLMQRVTSNINKVQSMSNILLKRYEKKSTQLVAQQAI